jgi:abortive infection bacteriophage resistance protein
VPAPTPKRPLSIRDQIDLLASRGLRLDGDDQATMARLLADSSYARLAPYWRHCQTGPVHGDKTFTPGATVAQIAAAHTFDSRLRQLLSQGLEVFEIALRARLGQEMAMAGHAHTYLDPASYISPENPPADPRRNLVDSMARELDRTKERAATRHTATGRPAPLWDAMGVFTLGTVSKMYRLLDNPDIRHRVARGFGYPNARFAENTFHSLSVLRNITAHHARIWHRADIQYAPPVLKRLQTDPDKMIYRRTPWAWTTVLADLTDTICGDHDYSDALAAFLQAHPRHIDGLKHPAAP